MKTKRERRAVPMKAVQAATANLFKNLDGEKQRSCGSCTECCNVLQVNDLTPPKPGDTDCTHQVRKRRGGRRLPKAGGCAIYDQRPQSCQEYRCYWLEGLLEGRDRPDRLGMIVDSSEGILHGFVNLTKLPIVVVRESRPFAHRDKRFQKVMAGLVSRVCVLYRGKGFPFLNAPSQDALNKLREASAKLDHWSLLTDHHREGKHAEAPVEDCPVCVGECPAHSPLGAFHPDCSVCHDALRVQLDRAKAEPVSEPPG